MMLYTAVDIAWLLTPDTRPARAFFVVQNILLFLLDTMMFVTLALVNEDEQTFVFYGFVIVFCFAVLTMVGMIYEEANRLLLNNMCMLLSIGFVMLTRLSFDKAIRQYVIVLLSLIVSLFIPFILQRVHFFKKLTWLYAALGILLLSVVLVMGEVTHGSKISFSLGGITFQPSEFVKIFYLFFLAAALWENVTFKRICLTAVLAGAHVIILVLSKDLGSAVIFFVGFVMVVYVATGKALYLLAGIVGGALASYVAYSLFDHVKVRVLAWRDPWSYIDGKGYQITQSLFAIGSGSWFGMGLGKGNPTAIPTVEADMIFSSVCEELGVLFGICLILICVCCFVSMIKLSVAIRDRFYQLIVYGIAIMYLFQIFLTVGGGMKFIPLTGVTLPFISYGGSSVMTTMILFFIVQGISIRLKREGVRRGERL